MSGIAIATIAAAGATFVFMERWRIRRDAIRRTQARRVRAPRRWAPLVALGAADPIRLTRLDADPLASSLAESLELAVRAGDEVWTYEARLFGGRTGESPFRMRRARVNGAERRFATALARVQTQAAGWLESTALGEGTVARHAIARVAETADTPGASRLGSVDAMIDILENALANLYRPDASPTLHPFR